MESVFSGARAPRRVGLALLVSAGVLAAPVFGSASNAATRRALHLNESANLTYVSGANQQFNEKGTGTGTIRCTVTLSGKVVGKQFISTVTASNSTGTVTATSSAALTTSGNAVDKFAGVLKVVKGTGRWSHISGSGQMTGTVNMNTYAATVHLTGTFPY